MDLVYCECVILTLSIVFCKPLRSHVSKCFPDGVSEGGCEKSSSDNLDEAAEEIKNLLARLKESECLLANPADYPPNYVPKMGEEFDFIVVGAGAAGSVVANRLSEVPDWNVLLLEAGGDPSKTSEVPALFPYLQKTDLDWQYKSDPSEDNCLGMKGSVCNLPRGKVLGGSSTINYMLYIRGGAEDYDGWAEEGSKGWAYKDVLPYFKKLEDMRAKPVQLSPYFSLYHNKGGPEKVEAWPNKEVEPVACTVADGMEELGYPVNFDVNGPSQTGYVVFQGTLENGRRCSTAKSYLTPARHRENFKVSKHSLATKVLINDKKTAFGVRFVNGFGKITEVRARKEVILSTGAINSPQLLMLSGIGPKEHLSNFNISLVHDLPVGKNLQDHPNMFTTVISLDFNVTVKSQMESMLDFLVRNDSIYSSLGMGSYASMINSKTGAKGYPDMEILTFDFAKNNSEKLLKLLDILNVKEENYKHYLEIVKDSYMLLVMCSLITPFSRGRVELRSNDPREYPNIVTGYLTSPEDIDIYLKTYEFLYSLVGTKSMKSRSAKLHEIEVPECMQHPFATKEYRICTMRHLTSTTYHQCGTCKMGPEDSVESVVDPQLRVIGIKGLRVVDASIFPKIPRGNIVAPVIMVGEKGSDIVKAFWLGRNSP